MPIVVESTGAGIATVILSGHGEKNYLYTRDLLDLAATLGSCCKDKSLRALIVTGSAGNFCGGRVGAKGLTRASEVAEDLNAILAVNTALNALEVPVIAAIEGQAFGFGFGFTAQSDYAIASEAAVFSLPEMSHGLPPLIVLSYLFRFVSYKRGFELALSSREIGAAEAADIGILTEVVPEGGSLARAMEVAESMLDFDPRALRLLRGFGRAAAGVHSRDLSEHAVAVMSIMLADRAGGH